MRGIQYLNNSRGQRVKAIVDLNKYGKEFAAFVKSLEAAESSNSNNSGMSSPFGSNPVAGDNIAYMGSSASKQVKVNALIAKAQSFYGTPYRTGGTTASGMDCSGLTQTVFKTIGV